MQPLAVVDGVDDLFAAIDAISTSVDTRTASGSVVVDDNLAAVNDDTREALDQIMLLVLANGQ